MGKPWVRHPLELREKVRQARRDGDSIKRIASREGLSNSTVCLWVRDINLSEAQVASIATRRAIDSGETFARRTSERHDQWRHEARELWARWRTEPRFLLGVGTYWGEGDKRVTRLVIANSDDSFVKSWIDWCRTFVPDTRIRLEVVVHPDVEEDRARSHWEHVVGSGIAVRVVRVKAWKRYDGETVRLPHGVARVFVTPSAEWHTKMLEWIRLAAVM